MIAAKMARMGFDIAVMAVAVYAKAGILMLTPRLASAFSKVMHPTKAATEASSKGKKRAPSCNTMF